MEQQHFSKSPITEAIIDLRVTPHQEVTAADLARMSLVTAEQYPNNQPLHTAQVSFAFNDQSLTQSDNGNAQTSQQYVGQRYASADGREILQARLDGFTFSVLRPYDRWETFSGEAHRLWNAYRAIVSPEKIIRVGVRYVNKIDVPKPSIEPRDYLRTYPEISSDAPNSVLNYFMQLFLAVPELKGVAIISQTIVPPPAPDTVSVILDLDLSRDASRSEEVPQDDAEIWAFFEQLRASKNAIFKACITERTKELIR